MQTLKHFIETEINKLEGFEIDFETNAGITLKEPPRSLYRTIVIIVDIPNTRLQDCFYLYSFQTDRQRADLLKHLDEVYCPDNLIIVKDPIYGDQKDGHLYNLIEADDTEKFFYDI